MYTEAEKRFGSGRDAVLAAYQPGQNPRQILDGFQNAYIAGTLGSPTALADSKAAACLTEEQRDAAYDLGDQGKSKDQLLDSENTRFWNGVVKILIQTAREIKNGESASALRNVSAVPIVFSAENDINGNLNCGTIAVPYAGYYASLKTPGKKGGLKTPPRSMSLS